ncbi:MAG: hypothetical protein U0694_22570 [Anaerolineae bacterium]
MERARKLGTALSALAGAYGAVVGLCLLLHWTLNEHLRPMMLFNSLLPAVLFPALGLLPLLLLARRWRAAVLQFPALLGFVLMYGYVFTPPPVPAAPEGMEISVLTFNISLKNRDFEAVGQLIRAANADLVALQEINRAGYFYLDDDLADLALIARFIPTARRRGRLC